jgi:hypothetical protein
MGDQLVPEHGAGSPIRKYLEGVVPDQTGRLLKPEHHAGGLIQ